MKWWAKRRGKVSQGDGGSLARSGNGVRQGERTQHSTARILQPSQSRDGHERPTPELPFIRTSLISLRQQGGWEMVDWITKKRW